MSTSSSASSKSSPASRTGALPASKPADPKPAAPQENCHLSKPTQTQELRGEIDSYARQHPSGYSTQVQAMNKAMKGLGIGISPCSQQSIKDSLRGVSQGTMTEKQAHAREAESFAKDSFESFAHGRPVQGTVERVGSALNAAAARALDGFDRLSDRFSPGPSSRWPGGGSSGGGGGTGAW